MTKINDVAMQLLIDENKALKAENERLRRCDTLTSCLCILTMFFIVAGWLLLIWYGLRNG